MMRVMRANPRVRVYSSTLVRWTEQKLSHTDYGTRNSARGVVIQHLSTLHRPRLVFLVGRTPPYDSPSEYGGHPQRVTSR